MKYFIVDSTIRDGEYEYLRQSPISAMTQNEATNKVKSSNRGWIKDDYREQDDITATEVTREEYKVLKKYIY